MQGTTMATLSGKTLFITGASRGIGRAIALRAAADGANIAIASKSAVANPKLSGTIHSVAAEVEAAGGQALALKCDIRDEDAVGAAVAATADAFGGIDIRSEEHTSELQSLMRISYAVSCLKTKHYTSPTTNKYLYTKHLPLLYTP